MRTVGPGYEIGSRPELAAGRGELCSTHRGDLKWKEVPKGGDRSGNGERQKSSLCSRALPQPLKSQGNPTNAREALRVRSLGVICRRGKMLNAQRDDGGNGIRTC